ncbi:MAG: hypothetical protein ACLFUB_20645 [Cyclobacteriaceae bacterium]
MRAQSLSITPHFNLLFPTCRLADNTQGYDTFGAQTFSVFSGDLGVFLEYKSKTRWGLMSGLSIGSAGLGYKISYQKPGALVSRFDIGISKSNSLHRIPLLFTYTWKNIHLFQLRNFRKLSQKKSIKVIDESILYAIVFKLQPIIGGSINYIGQLNRWDDPEDTLNTRRTVMYYDIHFSSKQLSTVNVSAIIGLRLQFYSFGKDKLALTVLYHQGFSDLVEMEVNYTIDGSDPYKSYVRTRGSGLSVTLSYPIQIYNFNKQQRKLRRQNN